MRFLSKALGKTSVRALMCSSFFKNETADKCGRLMNGATRSKSLTAIDLAELKSLVLTQWKESLLMETLARNLSIPARVIKHTVSN